MNKRTADLKEADMVDQRMTTTNRWTKREATRTLAKMIDVSQDKATAADPNDAHFQKFCSVRQDAFWDVAKAMGISQDAIHKAIMKRCGL